MEFNECFEELSKMFPDSYISLDYERTKTRHEGVITLVKAYINDKGWSPEFKSYDSIIDYFANYDKYKEADYPAAPSLGINVGEDISNE